MGLFDDLKGGKKPFPGTQVFCVLNENTKVCSETHPKTAKNKKNGGNVQHFCAFYRVKNGLFLERPRCAKTRKT